jgi:hypothetical protein
MAARIPEVSGASIVLLGSFNPRIFQPEWFARQRLLAQEQVDAADIKVIVPQISHFETEQFVLHVTEDRFTVFSKSNTNPVPLRDLVQGTFFILEHTPVSAMGMNHYAHIPLGTEEAWHQIGDKLAPKEGWREVLEERPGMGSLTILSGIIEPGRRRYAIKVEPSLQVKFGVYFEVNEHHQAPEADPLKSLMKTLSEKWEEAAQYADRVIDHILTWAETKK